MEAKKISFGFSKINKKLNLLPIRENIKSETKVELVKYLEGQEIKLVEEKPAETPLIIQLKEINKTSAALASLKKRRAVLLGEEEPEDVKLNATKPFVSLNSGNPEDIEKRAARELLAEIQKNGSSDSTNNLVLPVVKPDDLPLDGAKESTLDDYDSIPVQDFGKAMLRGMGWMELPPKTSKYGGLIANDTPAPRPKGMGLGADKALNKKNLLVAPEANEILEIKRNAYVLILGGKHKDLYGQIEGFDDHAGRVIAKMAIGGSKEVFNEFLCQPVSKKEYTQYGKCINSSKYEAYKRKENDLGQIILDKSEKRSNDTDRKNIKNERNDCVQGRHLKNSAVYERDFKHDCKVETKDIKRIVDNVKYKESGCSHDYDEKGNHKNEDVKGRMETNRNECTHQRGESRKDDARDDYRNYKNENRQREQDMYHSKSGNSSSLKSRRNDIDDNKSRYSRDCDGFFNRERDREHESDRDSYAKCSQYKPIDLDGSSDFKSSSYSSKNKKSEKIHSKKKSKKSKKSKSKHRSNSSDSEMSSSSAESSSESEEEKLKKHKKKTKKSKKQRERSRSRGRR